jgi:hypothetical protein
MADELRQANLSDLTLKQMTAEQRAEMRRRLEVFVDAFAPKAKTGAAPAKSNVRKWVPGMKR